MEEKTTYRCDICRRMRLGVFTHDDTYYKFYRCEQKAPNGESHSFAVPNLLGKARASVRLGLGLIAVGTIAKVGISATNRNKDIVDVGSIADSSEGAENAIQDSVGELGEVLVEGSTGWLGEISDIIGSLI